MPEEYKAEVTESRFHGFPVVGDRLAHLALGRTLAAIEPAFGYEKGLVEEGEEAGVGRNLGIVQHGEEISDDGAGLLIGVLDPS
jgi:hypothetical protein